MPQSVTEPAPIGNQSHTVAAVHSISSRGATAITDRVECRTIRTLDELGDLRAVWDSWAGTRNSDFDFFSSMVRSRGADCQPHVLLLTRNARPDAMLIALRDRRKLGFSLGYLTICEPQVNILEIVDGGLRGNTCEENAIALVREVMKCLDEGGADLALFNQVDVDSRLYRSVLGLPSFAFRDHCRCIDGHWFMAFPKSLDAFLMSISRSQRSKLRRKYSRILREFGDDFQVRCFRSIEELEPAILHMESIAANSDKWWMFGWGSVNIPQVRDQMRLAARSGSLRVYILYLRQKPAAFWMGTIYNHCLQADRMGYDVAWKKVSPGIFLFLKILQDLRDEDIRMIDFGWGDCQFRRCFGTVRLAEARVHIYAPTLRGIVLNLGATYTQITSLAAKSVAKRIGYVERIKKYWRHRLLHRRRQQNYPASLQKEEYVARQGWDPHARRIAQKTDRMKEFIFQGVSRVVNGVVRQVRNLI